jgi:hypothetical protein
MTISLQSPPLVPDLDRAVFLVLDDFGSLGRAWRETDDLEAVLRNLLRGQYHDPVKVVGFNASEAWSMDASAPRDQVRRVSAPVVGR